jgi:hypothetical protein
MRVMPFLRGSLLALAFGLLPGCSDGGDCLRPIQEFIPPNSPEAGGGGGIGGGQCAPWVEVGGIDSNWYRDLRAEGWRFHIDADELDPFDEATEANWIVKPVAGATVWSVRGIDPANMVVMRSADDGEYFFLMRDGSDADAVLCRYATGLEHTVREHCARGTAE